MNLDTVREIVGDTMHVALARRVAERGIVLVKDSLRSLPLGERRSLRVLSINVCDDVRILEPETNSPVELRRAYDSLRTEFVSSDNVAPDFQRVLTLRRCSADVVLIGSVCEHQLDDCDRWRSARVVDFVSRMQTR